MKWDESGMGRDESGMGRDESGMGRDESAARAAASRGVVTLAGGLPC